jgi:hypothetical protein
MQQGVIMAAEARAEWLRLWFVERDTAAWPPGLAPAPPRPLPTITPSAMAAEGHAAFMERKLSCGSKPVDANDPTSYLPRGQGGGRHTGGKPLGRLVSIDPWVSDISLISTLNQAEVDRHPSIAARANPATEALFDGALAPPPPVPSRRRPSSPAQAHPAT